jgi:putative aldouronate transport system permease protein
VAKQKSKKVKSSRADRGLSIIIHLIIILFCAYCVFPFLYVLGSSFEKEINIIKYGYTFIPKEFSTAAYEAVLKGGRIFRAYGVTIFTTVVGTFLSMVLTITMAYPLAQKKLKFRNFITFFVYFTMLFGGGLVPTYLLITKTLNLKNSIWVLIIPGLFAPMNMFLMRNFFAGIPEELAESAYMDGANDFKILTKIILPVSVPGIATISLFYALGYWNDWFTAMLYMDNRDLMTLQYYIMDLMRSTEAVKELATVTGIPASNLPQETLKLATTIITIGPIIFVYPFVQKYFTQGLTVGAIKG